MSKSQISTISLFTFLFVVLFFGFDTKPSNHGLIETSRALNMSTTDVSILKKEAHERLADSQRGRIDLLNAQLNSLTDSIERNTILKELSGAWFEFGFSSIAGTYAEEIAGYENSDDAWGIAATTYSFGIASSQSEKERKYCKEKAMKAFDIAISLNPNELRHQVNKAVTFG